MARDFTPHQQKIVNRYYEHRDTIRAEKLSDLVAELWLCEDAAKATKLWGRAQVALMKAGCDANQAAKIAGNRDLEGFAKLVQTIDAGGTASAGSGPVASAGPGSAADAEGASRPGIRSAADGRSIEQMKREKAAAAGTDSLEEANLKRALKAFRRKLKTARLEDESKLRGRYVTRGQGSTIIAIVPPYDYPSAVWQELARLGRLKAAGQGTYQLP